MFAAIQRDVRRHSDVSLVLRLVIGFVGAVGAYSLVRAPSIGGLFPPLSVLAFFAFDRWGQGLLNARAYARNHAACLPNDQIRVLDVNGLEATCTSSSARVKWAAVVRTVETAEFFLFFTTPNCAIQLPKRAVGDIATLRSWLDANTRRDSTTALGAPLPRS